MKLLLVIVLCISQALGGPQFWTSIPIGDPVVSTNIVPYVETARDLAVTFLDTAAKKNFFGMYLNYRLRFWARFGGVGPTALGGPQFWTSIHIGDSVVETNIVPYVESVRGLTVTSLDTAAKKNFYGMYLNYRLRFLALFGGIGPTFACTAVVYHPSSTTAPNWLNYFECDQRID